MLVCRQRLSCRRERLQSSTGTWNARQTEVQPPKFAPARQLSWSWCTKFWTVFWKQTPAVPLRLQVLPRKLETGGVNLDDTIVAIATPAGRGGLGVVRLAGPEARAIAAPMLRLNHPLEPGRALFGELIEPDGNFLASGS